ncbi:Cro-like protein [Paracoccus phage vB_PbeS_Pben1]|nr:Cro-like protein [Paracoccus phage vB_PbeS_Pben1]
MMEPAHTIIQICGGPQAVAEMTGRDVSRVRRWAYPKDRGGADGAIPADVQGRLLQQAVKRGIPLTPGHFFPDFISPTSEDAA